LIYKFYINHKECSEKNELQTDKYLFNSYRVLIQESDVSDVNKSNNKKKNGIIKERVLHILCLNPGLRLNQVLSESKPISFILTSGILLYIIKTILTILIILIN